MNSRKPLANVGKQFYTWATLLSFSGATFFVTLIWEVLKGINMDYFDSKFVPLVVSLVIMGLFAILTEPPKDEELTTWRQKGQKAIITVVNGLLVYSAVLGIKVATG